LVKKAVITLYIGDMDR